MQKQTLVQLVLRSNVLTPRQRYVVVRKIKSPEITEAELERIKDIITNEQSYVERAEPESDEAYAARLEQWLQELQNLQRTELAQVQYEEELSEARQDEAAANAALDELNKL